NGISVKVSGDEILTVPSADISMTVFDVLKLALWKSSSSVAVTLNDPRIHVDDSTVGSLIARMTDGTTEPSGEAVPSELREAQIQENTPAVEVVPAADAPAASSGSSKSILDSIGVSATLRNLCVEAEYDGLHLVADGINATAQMGQGLVFNGADINLPEVTLSGRLPAGRTVTVRDIRGSVDSGLGIRMSIASASYSGIASFSDLSAIARISEKTINAAVYAQDAFANLNDMGIGFDASVDGATFTVNYDIGKGTASAGAELDYLRGRYADASFSIGSFKISGVYDGSDAVTADISLESLKAASGQYSVDSTGLGARLSLDLGDLGSLGELTVSSAGFSGLEEMGLSDVRASALAVEYSYSQDGLGVLLNGTLDARHENDLAGNMHASVSVSAQTSDFRSLDFAYVDFNDIRLASLSDADLSVRINTDRSISASLSVNDDVSGSFGFKDGKAELSLFMTDLVLSDYKALYDRYMASAGVISSSTSLNGSIIMSSDVTESFGSWASSVLEGDYGSSLEAKEIFDVLDAGRISINTAARDIKVGERLLNGALTFEATVNRSIADISTLAVTAEGLRLSFDGSIDFEDMVPYGRLKLQNANDGSEYMSMLFEHEKGSKTYDYHMSSPVLVGTELKGTVNWADTAEISSEAVFTSSYIEGDFNFTAILELDPLHLSIRGDKLDMDVKLNDGLVSADGAIKDLTIIASESLRLTLDSTVNAYYSMDDSGFGVSFRDFSVQMGDGMRASLDLDLTDHSIFLENLAFENPERKVRFDGTLDYSFPKIGDLIRLDSTGLKGKVDIVSEDKVYSLLGSAVDNQIYMDFRVNGTDGAMKAAFSLLGERENAFHSRISLNWGKDYGNSVILNAMYDDRTLTLYDSKGRMGSLNLDNIALIIDFADLLIDGSVDVKNEVLTTEGTYSTQKGRVTVSARGESISDRLIQIFTGNDYNIDFNVGISDVTLEDGYELADLSIDMNLSNSGLRFSGNMVEGSYDPKENYIDINIDRELLFGFNARGYLGSDLDLLVSDIYFPLPILNQLMNSTMMKFTNGTIEGDVIIKGPASNPSFYGMAYCKSFEMTMFYLPDQMISVKNVALSLHDHELSLSRTLLSGYSESDGRYFYGDVSLDIVMQGLGIESFGIDININENTPIFYWMPMYIGTDFEVKGDISGYIGFEFSGGTSKLTTDIKASSMLIDFRFDEQMPDWFYNQRNNLSMDMDVRLTTGKDVEFYYPEKDNSFINFTLAEDRSVRVISEGGSFSTDGGISLKTGQVYYFHNDFIIKEGSLDLTQKKLSGSDSGIPIVLNLTAEITDYDSDGNKVVISMILQNATLDDLSPRFSSTPMKTENEILAMLGQSVMSSGALDQNLSLSSLATFAATATETLTRVGMLESNKNYSITGIVRNSLGLDIFSARSNILSNIIIDALPGELAGRGDISLLARYLDGTSLFAGKYIGLDWFIKIRLMLKADSHARLSSNVGNFLSKDLILDTEISLDWDTPMGTWSMFTNPRELSVFDILDTIGFSVTNQIQI
ncbi:MAG: hypothetical protein ILP16_09425, partial [Spirochaetales bacterium]|nr:hypothetical protein [Spirochaetales bacterium]